MGGPPTRSGVNILCIVFFPIPEDENILGIGFLSIPEGVFSVKFFDSTFYVGAHPYLYIYI